MVYELYVAMYVHYTIHLYCLQQKQASKQESKQSNKPASKANKETNEQRNMPIWHEAFKSHGTLLWDFLSTAQPEVVARSLEIVQSFAPATWRRLDSWDGKPPGMLAILIPRGWFIVDTKPVAIYVFFGKSESRSIYWSISIVPSGFCCGYHQCFFWGSLSQFDCCRARWLESIGFRKKKTNVASMRVRTSQSTKRTIYIDS